MARRARFGRQPRVQQSIGGTLVSIAREMQAREDSNLMDAWKNGGKVHGKQVTDGQVLAYWKARGQNLDKADPAYDTIKSQIMQLEYGIEQSKQDLAHIQGKISDQQYAQFFLKWAGKVPKQGEFWRVLQKDAAQLMEAAKEKSRINAEKVKIENFNKFTAARQGDIDLGNALTEAINGLARETGLNIDANGDALLRMLGADFKANPSKYHRLTDSIQKSGKDFSGAFTHSWVSAQITNSEGAYDQIAVRAKKDGYADAYNSATKGQAEMQGAAQDMGSWSVAQAYDRAYAAYNRTAGDPNASDKDKVAAAAAFAGSIQKMAGKPGLATATVSMLQADAKRLLGEDGGDSPSFGQALGHPPVDAGTSQAVAVVNAAQLAMDQNPGAYVYAPRNPDGTFDPSGKGPVGIVAATGLPSDVTFVAVPGLNGKPSMVAVQPHAVYATDPNNPTADPVEVGKTVEYNVGGKTITMTGYVDDKKAAHWTLGNPWADGTTSEKGADGTVILHPGFDPQTVAAKAAQLDGDPAYAGMGIASLLSSTGSNGSFSTVHDDIDPETKKVISKTTVAYKNGQFTVTKTAQNYDPTTGKMVDGATVTQPVQYNTPASVQTLVTAPSAYTGGNVPGSYTSVAQASVAAANSIGMSPGQVAALAKDPNFQHAFATQTMQNLGTDNPLDPRVIKAWEDATASAQFAGSVPGIGLGNRTPNGRVIDRADLNLPAADAGDKATTGAQITFGGQTLNLPKAPAYLTSVDPAKVGANLATSPFAPTGTDTSGGFHSQVLLPGQQPGQAAPPGAAATVGAASGFGTVTPTAKPTVGTAGAPAPTPTVNAATGFTTTPTSTPGYNNNHGK